MAHWGAAAPKKKNKINNKNVNYTRAETECDGTRKRTGGEMKGKKANGGGSQQWCTVSDTVYPALLPLMRTPRLPATDWTDTPADINGLVPFAGKPNLVSARVPSRSVSALPPDDGQSNRSKRIVKVYRTFYNLIICVFLNVKYWVFRYRLWNK